MRTRNHFEEDFVYPPCTSLRRMCCFSRFSRLMKSTSYAFSVRLRIPAPSTATSYSVRRATIGSMADARRAGRYPANKATRRRSMETNAVVGRSLGERSKRDRKSTRLNSSHRCISYAVFCLKKKKKKKNKISDYKKNKYEIHIYKTITIVFNCISTLVDL